MVGKLYQRLADDKLFKEMVEGWAPEINRITKILEALWTSWILNI